MNYLLDTHSLIWFQENNPRIPGKVLKEIENLSNTIFFSQLSLYEIAIKQKIGKLPLFQATPLEVYDQAIKDNFTFQPLLNAHIEAYKKVPLFEEHRDPFDRLLIATAHSEYYKVITIDSNFSLYDQIITVFW